MADTWYFAYGSNLWIDQKEERTSAIRSGAQAPQTARLADYRLAFNKPSKKWKFVANIMSCPGEEVIGVVYRCNQATMEQMDSWEPGYKREDVPVVLDNGESALAITYVAESTVADGQPAAEYVAKIIAGARQHGLPQAYIDRIRRLANGSSSSAEDA
jgi:gamma-glutamylcyclotransferase